MDIVPEDRDIVFNAGHGEALRPPKCFGRVPASRASRPDATRVGAKPLEEDASGSTGCYSIACRI